MRRLGALALEETRIYLTGGATAVLLGWWETTIDVDIKIVPERDEIFRSILELKESLHLNIELASPDLFIPAVPGWESRIPFIVREGRVDWHHFDPYSQASFKIQRDHDRDRIDVNELIRLRLVQPPRLRESFEQIRGALIRYPAIDPRAFARRLEQVLERS
jgi:hypothetical protein